MARIRGPQDLPGFVPTEPVVPDTQKKFTGTPQQQKQKKGPFELIPIPKAKEDSVIAQGKEAASDKLPDPADPKLTFGQKLNAGLDKIFNMQENDPEAYRKVMSGFDIYLRGQRGDDLITAITGNSKFNAEQASALLQANLAANNLKLSEMKVLEAERDLATPDKVEKGELEIAKNIIKGDVDKDDLEAVGNFVAGKAKQLQTIAAQNNLTLGFNEAVAIAYKQLEQTGELKDTSTFGGTFGKELTINPDAVSADKTRSLKELKSRPSNKGKTDDEIRAAVEANGLTLVD
jgi:hypothetical protein